MSAGSGRFNQTLDRLRAATPAAAGWLSARRWPRRRQAQPDGTRALRLLVVLPRPLVSCDDRGNSASLAPDTLPGQEPRWVPVRPQHGTFSCELLDQAFCAQHAPLAVRYLRPPTLVALQEALSDHYHALLFSGYSLEDGALVFEGIYGEQHPVAARELGRYLRGRGIRLIWLHTANAAAAAQDLTHAGIIVVSDTARATGEEPNVAALAACFAALSRGRNVRQALAEARRELATGLGQATDGANLQLHARRWPAPRLVRPGATEEYRGEAAPLPAPAPLPTALVGREVDSALINLQLAQRRLVALAGPPGVGKTALARAVARWRWERGRAPAGVRFVSLRALPNGVDLLDELLSCLLPDYRAPAGLGGEGLRRHKVSRLSAHLGQKRWLLVLDGLEAVHDPATAALLQKLLQRCAGLHLLLTADECAALAEEAVFPVGPLSLESAVELFCQQSGHPYTEPERVQVAAVCEALACVPLAVVLVARCSPQRPAETLEELCRSRPCPPAASLGPAAGDAADEELHQPQGALQLALDYSYSQLSVPARRLLCALAVFRGGATTEALQAVLRSIPDTGPALDELVQRNLIERDLTGGDWRYRLLSPVTRYADRCLRQEAEMLGLDRSLLRRSFAEHFLKIARQMSSSVAAVEVAPDTGPPQRAEAITGKTMWQPTAPEVLDGDRANLLAAMEEAYGTGAWEVAWRLAQHTAELLSLRSRWMGGERTYLLALDAARRRGDARQELETLDGMGNLRRQQGRWAEANTCFEHAMIICDELNDLRAEGRTRVSLGAICADQGRWDEAMACYEGGLRALRQAGDCQGEGRTLGLLGSIHRRQGRWSVALSTYQQALRALRHAGDRQGEAEMLNHLGRIYGRQNRWDEAVRVYEESLRISRDLLDRCGESRALSGLGYTYHLRGCWAEATACYEQDLVICRQLDNPYGEGRTLTRLGLVHARQGHWATAIGAQEEALHIFLDLEDCQEQGRALTTLSEVYRLQGQQVEAVAACQQALRLFPETGDHHSVGQALAQMGLIHAQNRRWGEAISAYEGALHLFRRISDRDGEGRMLARMGVVYARQGRWAEAGSIFEEALGIVRQLGICRSEVKILYNLGQVYTWQGRWADAITCYERVLALRDVLQDSRAESRVLGRLGSIHRLRQEWKEAIACYRQEQAICRGLQDRLGEGKALANLAGIHDRHSRWVRAIPLYQASIAIFQEHHRSHDKGRLLTRLGLVYARQARWPEAGRALQEGLETLRQLQDRYGEGKMLCRLARVHLDQGHWTQALDLYQQGMEIFRALGKCRSEARVLNELGAIHRLQGRWAEALACCERDLAIRRQVGDRRGESQALSNLGDIHRRQGCWAEAIACYEQGLAICRQLGDRQGEGKVLTILAGVHADKGDRSAAIAVYQDSLLVFRAVFDRCGEAQALTALGLVHARQGDEGSAIARWYQALAIYEQLQAPEADQVRGLLKEHLGEDQVERLFEAHKASQQVGEDEL